ncbi:MAG: VWA domain-containing protein, partial [Elusimicrobiota bacterium]
PYVKKFTEEREMTVLFLVDMSGSQRFGTRGNFKAELAAELTSVLAFSAIKNNDRVGMVMFTDKIEKVIRPKKGRNHILRMIRETLYFTPTGTGTNITRALQYLNELWRRKSVVFLISDFNDAGFDQALKVTARRHDLIAVTIADDREKNLPDIGLVELEDAESGQKMTVDTSSAPFIKEYTRRTEENAQRLKTLFTRAHVDSIAVTTGKPYIVPLIQFFRTREKRQATGR